MKTKTNYPMGSISSGTMRNEDLIPDFVWELKSLAKSCKWNKAYKKEHLALCARIEKEMEKEGYFDSDDAVYDLNEDLFNALDQYAAPYFYFGSHPGDGADYGFWLSENMEEDFDGLKVEDLSEIPKDYAGEIIVVNDHGNMTLYHKAKTQNPKEIWAVV
ncbi:MAG: hypothetical protein WC332_00990 [Clostridia bacterium]|jgi:hypothetical protein